MLDLRKSLAANACSDLQQEEYTAETQACGITVQIPMNVYQTMWQTTDCPGKNEPIGQDRTILKHCTSMLIGGRDQTFCEGRTLRLNTARKAEYDQTRRCVACCAAILQVLQQGHRQTLCVSLMGGKGLSGEKSL